MSYKIKQFEVESKVKVFKFLIDRFNLSISEAQRWIDKGRVLKNGVALQQKSAYIEESIEVVLFVPETRALHPTFEAQSFLLYDKPSGVLVHPRNRHTSYSLTHELKFRYGPKANITHRIDKETSGLLLCAKDPETEKRIKLAFERREIKKGYLALVRGKIDRPLFIDAPIYKNRDYAEIKLKVFIDARGKASQTRIVPLKYYPETDMTLVEALPLTGRQHQIRIHLFHVKHPIVGDPIYGVTTQEASDYLDRVMSDEERRRVTGATRLMLHAEWMEFRLGNRFKIHSKMEFASECDALVTSLCRKRSP